MIASSNKIRVQIKKSLLIILLSLSIGTLSFPNAARASVSYAWGDFEAFMGELPYCYVCAVCCRPDATQQIIYDAFDQYRRDFIMGSFYRNYYEGRGLKPTADALRDAWEWSALEFGKFYDGLSVNSSLGDLQSMNVKTMQRYAPSGQVCRFGTLSRSLSASEASVATNQQVISDYGLSRNLGRRFSMASAGRGLDNSSRVGMFITNFCDLQDNNSGLNKLCRIATPAPDKTHNLDIDYTRNIDERPTIFGNFTDATLTTDENSVLALSSFLYGHNQQQKRLSKAAIDETKGSTDAYMEYRSVVARRAAAMNTFANISAMKTNGSGASDTYLKAVLTQLGLPADSVDSYFGASGTANASYYAQMEILTKKMYQDPAFFANLMDSRANVDRISAALDGISLMQDRDTFKSTSRSEMLLAILVEMEARKVANNLK